MGPALLEFARARAFPAFHSAVSTRVGGVSLPPYDSLNTSFAVGDEPRLVARNREIFLASLGVSPARAIIPRQVHGNRILRVDSANVGRGVLSTEGAPEADVLLTTERGLALVVQSADCPTLAILSAPAKGIALVHSGWRGVAAGAAPLALRALAEATGAHPRELFAFLAPAIEDCCYEVSLEVLERTGRPRRGYRPSERTGHAYLSLRERIAEGLEAEGLPRDRMELMPGCTHCDAERFFSHRRDGPLTGRFALGAWLGEE